MGTDDHEHAHAAESDHEYGHDHGHDHSHEGSTPPSPAKLRLKQSGLRVTASRIAVLELLAAASEPRTHQEVVDVLGESTWNRSTLYRNLIDLTEAGLLRKTVIAGLARFEPAGRDGGCGEHAHFVCSDCGEVTHLDGVTINVVGSDGPRAVTAGHVEVQLRGRCDGCTPDD